MTHEYQSKLNDAFRMVMEDCNKTYQFNHDKDEGDFLTYMDSLRTIISNSFVEGDMKRQLTNSKRLAALSILYMVKFL